MKNKKLNLIVTIVIVAVIILTGAIIFLLNYSSNDNNFSILEKKWVTDNINKIVDVHVYNDVPVYGYNGEGLIFDFLDYFTKKYSINFNKVSYYVDDGIKNENFSFMLLNDNEKLDSHDILMYKDHYVVLSLKEEVIGLDDIHRVGILKSESALLSNYLADGIEIVEYEDIVTLTEAIQKGEIPYVILPNMKYMDDILSKSLKIVYHIRDLNKSYVLRVKDSTTYQVMKKSYSDYLQNNYYDDYSKNYLNVYFTSTGTSDLLRKNYNAKSYKYGYVINMPYENVVNNQFVGTISNYLKGFERQTGVEIEITPYNTIDDLKSALVSESVDFALGNFFYDNINLKHVTTNTINQLDYVVLSKNFYSVNSIKGLDNKKVSVVGASRLHQLCKENNIDTKNYDNTDELLSNIDDQSIGIVDEETYIYYKDTKLKDYKIILEGNIRDGYKFILNAKNEPFNSLFSYYVGTVTYSDIRYQYHTDITLDKDYTSIKVLVFTTVLVLFLILTIWFINRRNVTNTIISKDEMLKYIDPMTSLKNRSYLNFNIYKWDDNVIFPQSVVVLDINELKEVNDRLGREAGDEIIKRVASILINNQLENTDIIRSGGDEFLIYMIGYEEKSVVEYTRKLAKEMKDIPNSLGVEVGYSMILDEVKTVDDAINEAIIMMSKNKEKRKSKNGKI